MSHHSDMDMQYLIAFFTRLQYEIDGGMIPEAQLLIIVRRILNGDLRGVINDVGPIDGVEEGVHPHEEAYQTNADYQSIMSEGTANKSAMD